MISASQIFFLQWSQRPSFFRDCMTAENILSVGNRDVWWKKQRLTLNGTVQQDFLPSIFSQMDSSQAPYSVFKDFSNLALNSRRYSRFFIDSPLLFIAESQYSPYCLIRRVATLRFIIAGSHYWLELSALTLAYRLIRRVDTPRIVYYGESWLPASFIAESHCWQQRVIQKNSEGLPLPLKGQWSKNELYVQSTAYQEHFKREKNMGCLRLNFWLPAVSNSGESIFSYFKYK
jgi:hypothetical protein